MNSSATISPTATIRALEKRPRSCARSGFIRPSLLRPRLRAAVHPEPVVGPRTHLLFHGTGDLLGEILDGRMAGQGGLERTFHDHQVRAVGPADGKGGDERSARAQRERGGRRRGTGLVPEEIHEDAPAGAHVLVDGERQHLAAAQEREGVLAGTAVGEMADPRPEPALEDPAAESVLEVAHDDGELHPAPRGDAREELEVAEVGDGTDHAMTPRLGGLEDVPAFEPHERVQVPIPEGEQDLHQAPAQLAVGGAADPAALALGSLGEGAPEPIERDRAADAQHPRQGAGPLAQAQQGAPHSTSPKARSRASSPRRMRTATGTATMPSGRSMRTRSFSVVTSSASPAWRRSARRSAGEYR